MAGQLRERVREVADEAVGRGRSVVQFEVEDRFVRVRQCRLAAIDQQLVVPRWVCTPLHVGGGICLAIVVHPRHYIRAHLSPEEAHVA